MTGNRNLYSGYEQALLGNRKDLPMYLFASPKDQGSRVNRSLTLALYIYAGTYLCGWTKEQFASLLTVSFEKDFMLYDLGEKYLDIPPNMDEEERRLYITSLCFPSMRFDVDKCVTDEYERVLKTPKHTWRSNYFSNDMTGMIRANICLRHCITKYFTFISPEELYRLFDDTDKAYAALNSYGLKKACEKLYASPLEYLHSALSNYSDTKDDFMYAYLAFKKMYDEVKGR